MTSLRTARQSTSVIGSTAAAVLLTHYAHQAMGTGFVFLMWWFVPAPWVYLMFNWHNPSKHESWAESTDFWNFSRLFAGVILPVIIIGYISANFSFHAALSVLFGVNTLLFWYLITMRASALRAEDAARKDAKTKQSFIEFMVSCSAPLSRFLSQYHPAWYPPPISDRLTTAIALYATFIRNLTRAKGDTPSNQPDAELIRYGFSRNSFPSEWDFDTTAAFCGELYRVITMLAISAAFSLEENRKYEAVLTGLFEAKDAEAEDKAKKRLPPQLVTKMNRVFDVLESVEVTAFIQLIEDSSARLTALIPDHVAQTRTVIGMPVDDVPVAYQSLETRYYHTFLIGRSGRGKSTVITNMVAQDIHKGYGVIVMSPDQDLMTRILPYIPEHRLDDVIYFDPSDTTPPVIGFNPFFFEPPTDPVAYLLLKTRKAGETYTVLERTLEIDTEPTRRLLNNAMFALIARHNTTLNDLRRLIDPKERAFHAEVANDPRVDNPTREFWATYATESANAMVYRNLIGRMIDLLRPPLFDIFSTQSFSFHRELNEHSRILLIDLSNFSRDSREAKITAQLLIATIQQTILRRDKMRRSDYLPYFMYIDEFQNFADTNERSIGAMAEQLRKYSFGLTLTSLVASDLSTRLFDTIIGVMSTFICLSISAKDAGRFASEMSIKRTDRDSFNPEALQKLQVGQAYVLTPPHNAAVYVQIPREPPGNLPQLPTTIDDLKKRSQANFGAIPRPVASPVERTDTVFKQADESPISPAPVQQPPPKRTNRRGRKRFEDNEEPPLIEVC